MSQKNELVVRPAQKAKLDIFGRKDLAYRVAPYFFKGTDICNFAVSGHGDKAHLMSSVFKVTAGRIPVIILHNANNNLMQELHCAWIEEFGPLENGEAESLWSCNTGEFELFLGLGEMDIVQILKKLAETEGYTCTVNFENIVKAHLRILKYMECPYSLSGLYYLCSFKDIDTFQNNIMALRCSKEERKQIIADLGLINEREQFNQFRSIIINLGYEAERSGWSASEGVGRMSINSAIRSCATMTLSISARKSPLLMAYLSQEIQLCNNDRCLIIIDEIFLGDSGIIAALQESGPNFHFGILGQNVLGMIGTECEKAQTFCEQLDVLILLRHHTYPSADALSALIGSEDVEDKKETKGFGKKQLAFLPDSIHKAVAIGVKQERRVKPEQIMQLASDRAILFLANTNQVVFL